MIVEAQVTINGSKGAVWAAITDIEKASETISGIENIEVLLNSFLANGLGNRDDTTLGQPAQDDLRHRLFVLRRERYEQRVLENVVLAFRKRSPGFNLHPVLLQELVGFNLLVERMGFDLVHGRSYLMMNGVLPV